MTEIGGNASSPDRLAQATDQNITGLNFGASKIVKRRLADVAKPLFLILSDPDVAGLDQTDAFTR